ncbi:MAG: HlyC/CorC family transporter [Bacilli bacterium]|nr:HlyC/CorC family transporter [Bacilli bacterium]
MYYPWYWVIIVICGIASAFFSASDLVYSIVDQDKLKRDIQKGNKKAKLALYLAEKYEFSISTILFANNVVNVLASSLVAAIAVYIDTKNGTNYATTISTIIMTIVIIIFCEFLPKAFAKRFNYIFALNFAPIVRGCEFLFFIFVWPISKIFELFGKLFKKRSKEEDKIDEDVLNEMVDEIEESGEIEEDNADIVRNAIDLNDIQAYEIMTPRVEVFALDIEEDIEEVIKEGEIFKHSRIPVYEDTIDNIIGIVPIKAIARALFNHQKIDLKQLMYKPLIIPRNHQILDLLQEFKQSKVHIAIVIDEYGGTEGIITMEDILEQIVGEIYDETDDVEIDYAINKDGSIVVNGAMNIDDFFELIQFDPEEIETDYTTVGGFCQDILDRFAKEDDEFDWSHYHFRVLEASQYTVEKLLVIDTAPEEDE